MSPSFKKLSFLSLVVLILIFTPSLLFAANCNSASPKITITTITPQQPNPAPQFFKSEILNKNRVTQVADIYGGAIIRVTVENLTNNNSCYFNRLGNITGCKMTKTERKAGQVVATSTSYFSWPSSKEFIFTPKDLNSNLVLDFSCGNAIGKYSIGSAVCERPFDQIVEDLAKYNYTIITENSFREWAEDDRFDNCGSNGKKCVKTYSYPTGMITSLKRSNSGDKGDIVKYMIQDQCEYHCAAAGGGYTTCKPIYFNSWPEEKDKPEIHNKVNELAILTSLGYPTSMTIRNLDWGVNLYLGPATIDLISPIGHAVILTEVIKRKFDYDFNVVDPNYPNEVTKIEGCRTSDVMFKFAGKTRKMGVDLYCSDSKYGPIAIHGLDSSVRELDYRAGIYNNLCNQSGVSSLSLCNRKPLTKWLENNLISIENPADNGGNCHAWAQFVLDVTYQGEFGYECPRPASGSAPILKSLQLANIQDSINQIIEQIKKLKIN